MVSKFYNFNGLVYIQNTAAIKMENLNLQNISSFIYYKSIFRIIFNTRFEGHTREQSSKINLMG